MKFIVQVASNFNAHECGGERGSPLHPDYLIGLMSDSTQGPSAAGGAAAGAVLRVAQHKVTRLFIQDCSILNKTSSKSVFQLLRDTVLFRVI